MVFSAVDVRALGIRRRWVALGSLPAVAVALLWWADPPAAPPGTHPALTPDRADAVLLTQVATAAVAALVLLGRAVRMWRSSPPSSPRHRDVTAAWGLIGGSCALVALGLGARAVLPGPPARWWWAAQAALLVLGLAVPVAAHLVVRRARRALSPTRAVLDGVLVLGGLGLLAGGPLGALGEDAGSRQRVWLLLLVAHPALAVVGLVLLVAVLERVGLTAGFVVLARSLVLVGLAGALRLLAALDPSSGHDLAAALALALALGWVAAAGLQPVPARVPPPQPWQGLVFGLLVPQLLLLATLLVVAVRGLTGGGARPPVALVVGVVLAAALRHLAGMLDSSRLHTDLRRSRSALHELALVDQLTGVPNRRAFTDAVDRSLRRTARGGRDVVVALLDVDGFSAVNDRCGHAAGDAVLVAVARRLESGVRRGDLVARLGGDEFAVLCEAAAARSDEQDAGRVPGRVSGRGLSAALEHRLRMAFSVPLDLDADAVRHVDPRVLAEVVDGLGVSLGVVAAGELSGPAGRVVDGDELVRAADELVRRSRRPRVPVRRGGAPPAAGTAGVTTATGVYGWQEEWDDRRGDPPG